MKYGKIILKDGTKYYNRVALQDENFDFIGTAVNVALEQIMINNKKYNTLSPSELAECLDITVII